jgi:hypothetical protein
MQNAILQLLSMDDRGRWSEKIQCHISVEDRIQPRKLLLAGLAPVALLTNIERRMEVTGLQKAMMFYI